VPRVRCAMRPFGTGESEIASYDLAALMRRVEARRMERERRELARAARWNRIVRWVKGIR
jgi:hypothetical protein